MKQILIVEDDDKIAMALMIRLKANGYKTAVAPDAVCGVNLARTMKPDLILLDICMPAGNGFQVAETLLRLPETNGIPVIFITASKDPDLLQRVTGLGATELFEKPLDTEKLLSSIAVHLKA
ncbi:MAG: response regulator [Verrucomicrobiota bacterium]